MSAYGTGLGFGAFAIIAIRVLHAGAAQVAILSACGLGVGALVAVPLGPWVEFRRKRPVMVAMDLVRFAALLSIPVAYALGPSDLRAARGGFDHRRRGQERLPGGERRIRQGAGGTRGSARRQRAVRVHHVERDRGRTAARGRRDRPARTRDDRRCRCDQLPALRGGNRRDPPRRTAPAAHRSDPAGPAGDLLDGWRYILTHPQSTRPVLQHHRGQRAHPGHRTAAVGPHARPAGLRPVAVRPRLRDPVRGRPGRRAAGPPARGARRAGEGHVRSAGRCAPAGRSGWCSSVPGSPGSRSSWRSSSAWSPASASSTR